MKIVKITAFILMIACGAFLVVYGERDDSPGAQLLGLVIAILGLVGVFKNSKKR